VGLDQALDDEEPQADPVARGAAAAPVAIKDVGKLFGRDAGAAVRDSHADLIGISPQAHDHGPAGRREVNGVSDQVLEHLLHSLALTQRPLAPALEPGRRFSTSFLAASGAMRSTVSRTSAAQVRWSQRDLDTAAVHALRFEDVQRQARHRPYRALRGLGALTHPPLSGRPTITSLWIPPSSVDFRWRIVHTSSYVLGEMTPRSHLIAPRNAERTRGRLLQAAFQEIHRSGFRSADVDAILATAGVTKGALYYHFDGKEALGYAVVDEVVTRITREKWLWPLKKAKNPINALIGIIESTSLRREDLERGCPLNNLSQEMSPVDEGFRTRTAKVFRDWHDAIAAALREGQKRGVVRSDVDADETATFLVAAYEGCISLAKNSQDARVLQSGQRSLVRHLESLRAARTRPLRPAGRG
jgi:TetR/AcrR family transcriptional repressor of nem operon